MQQVTAYKCDHCNMTSIYKANVKRHEQQTCQKAPGACGTCALFATTRETRYNRHHGGNPGSTDWEYTALWCNESELNGKRTGCKRWEERRK